VRFVAAGLLCLLATPSLAQSDPRLDGCVYPKDVPEQAIAESVMALALPYLDKEVLYYRDEGGQPTGSHAVRRSLRIYFYDKNDVLMGTAVRRSPETTSYFAPDGEYLGNCVHHRLVPPDRIGPRIDPAPR
jgi:hypothetical protein